jgi:putative YhdH/YhfP family quinone oxidoreductase
MADSYRAFVVEKDGDQVNAHLTERPLASLPEGDVTIRVAWSSVNYKDGLATLAAGGVVRNYPLVIGIDLAGTVAESADARFKPGDAVLVTGYDTGVAHDGGYAEMARVPADWVVPLPKGLSAREAMIFGTAGFTAALAIQRLEHNGVKPDSGEVLVTGATGGVGSIAVAMLAGLGYRVAASTGKESEHDYLKALGASRILSRDEVSAEARPIGKATWAGAVDQVGGSTLAWVLSTMAYRGCVACTGLTGGPRYSTTVLPLILRGVSVLGVDSVMCPMDERLALWQRMAGDLKPAHLDDMIARETDLDGLADVLKTILKGGVRGRTVVKIA